MAKGDDSLAVGLEAGRKALSGISKNAISVVLVFASVRYDLEETLEGIHRAVGEVPILGTSTAGEIYNAPQKESVVVVALASRYLAVRVGVGEKVSGNWSEAVAQAVSKPGVRPFFSPQDGTVWQELTRQGKTAFGVLFSPGNTRYANSQAFEILNELKGLSQGQLPIFGGGAADDWRMETNYVFYGKRAYPDGLLVAVFETSLQFGIALAHGFRPGSERASVTRTRGHEVVELDGEPAANKFAALIGLSKKSLEGKHLTLTSGRPVGSPDPYGQYSINVASYFTPDGGVRLAQPVPEGSILTIMEADREDLVAAGSEALRKALLRGHVSNPAVVLVFSCALRRKILGERVGEEISRIREMVSQVPVVGFSSFGEQGLADDGVNRHYNEVVATLVIGQKLSYAAMVALENQRLHEEMTLRIAERERAEEQLRLAHTELEKRVDERTADLVEANEHLQQEIKERRRIEVELLEKQQTLRDQNIALVRKSIDLSDIKREMEDKNYDLEVVRADLEKSMGDLKEGEERFRTLFQGAAEGILVAGIETRQLRYANPALCNMLGYSEEDLRQMRITDLHPEEASERVISEFEAQARGEKALAESVPCLRKDGTTIYADINSAKVLVDGCECNVGFFTDTTDRKRAEEELRESEKRFRQLSEATFEAIVLHEDGVVLRANDQFFKMFGYKPDELIGKQMLSLVVAPESLNLVKKKITSETKKPYEYVGEKKDGTKFLVESRIKTMDYEGRNVRVAVMRDVTVQRQFEEQLVAHREKLRSLASELSLAEERERRRIAAEVHDHIGQNLAFAKMKLAELPSSTTSANLRSAVNRITQFIDRSIQDVRALVSDLGSPVLYELGFVPAVQWLVQRTENQHGIVMDFEDDRVSKPLSDDVQVLLFQSARELLVNIAKHSKARTGKVSVSRVGDYIKVEVADDGIGFDATGVGPSVDRTRGFGLFSIHERLEPVGGAIHVESKADSGTQVTILAPLG
jgi:PAS domain S-box-containing protein